MRFPVMVANAKPGRISTGRSEAANLGSMWMDSNLALMGNVMVSYLESVYLGISWNVANQEKEIRSNFLDGRAAHVQKVWRFSASRRLSSLSSWRANLSENVHFLKSWNLGTRNSISFVDRTFLFLLIVLPSSEWVSVVVIFPRLHNAYHSSWSCRFNQSVANGRKRCLS